ncbi:hypothetical protein TWF132_011139 [Orbilia oligospora]|nr:hypothetical protein TWF132_011139 [Orbilia oligospora]
MAPVLIDLPKSVTWPNAFAMVPPGFVGIAAAISSKHSALAIESLHHLGADLNAVSHHGITAAHVAARQINPEALAYLITAGANFEARSRNLKTPLHFAALIASMTGNCKCLELLLSAGADVNAAEAAGHRPIHMAVYGKETKGLELLLHHPGIDKHTKNNSGRIVN